MECLKIGHQCDVKMSRKTLKNLFTPREDSFLEKLQVEFEYRILDPLRDWVYPGYKLRNLLFNRYDLVRLKQLSKTEYCSIDERMFQANMELIVQFIEKERPEEFVVWYGDEGPKYGVNNENILYPELKGKYILDIIKDIYNFYKKDLLVLEDDYTYLLRTWSDFVFVPQHYEKPCEDDPSMVEICSIPWNEMKFDDEELNKLNKDILLKYLKNIDEIKEENKLHDVMNELSTMIHNKKQYYLHLCIEVRNHLWT